MTGRRGGWWGVAFVVTLFVGAAMVSVPTGSEGGRQIQAFYAAHATVVVVQQVLAILALGFLLAFALALGARRRPWLLVGSVLVAIAELATNIPPVVLAVANLGPDGAHTLTVIEDIADGALFVSIAVFSVAATMGEMAWVRAVGFVVAAVSLLHVVMTPLGVHALDVVAPTAFLGLVLLVSIRLLLGRSRSSSTRAAAR